MPGLPALTPSVAIAHRPRPGHPSQDRHLVQCGAVAVLDGATSPDFPPDRDAAWYADKLTAALAGRLGQQGSSLARVLEASIAEVTERHGLVAGASPSSTVTLLRWADGTTPLQALVLADTALVVRYVDGTVDVHCDNRIDRFAAESYEACRTRLAAGSGYDAEHHRLLRDLGAVLRTGRNQPGGFWIAEADPRAAREALCLSVDPQRISDLAVLTDGASAAVDLYGVCPDWADALDLMRDRGPDALLDVVREAEATDPDGRRWPRVKPHDDATAVYLDFTGLHRNEFR